MFGKKCARCGKKIGKDFDFCPYCGNRFYKKEEDWGMFGKNDFAPDFNIKMPLGFNTLFNSLVKQLDKQLKEIDKEIGKENGQIRTVKDIRGPFIKKGGISISISSSGDEQPKIKVHSFGNVPEFKKEEGEIKKEFRKKIEPNVLSDEKIKKLSSLPRQEPKTEVRRLSNKIVYEIDMPGVKSVKDVIVNKLENSIEIKAIGKDRAYLKLIPINLPIKNYKLKDEKLILELEAK